MERVTDGECTTDPNAFFYIPYDSSISNFGPWIIGPIGGSSTEPGCFMITQSVTNQTPTHSLVYSPPDCAGCIFPR